jgi:hypothetical protein
MHGPINVKSPNNISKWQMGFNSAFKGLKLLLGVYVLTNVPTQVNSYDITWLRRGGVLANPIKTSAAKSTPSVSRGENEILLDQPLQIVGAFCLWGAKQDAAESNDKHH